MSQSSAVPDLAPTAAVHPSLVRPVLYVGVERHVIALEATVVLALVLGVGPSVPTAALVAVVVCVLHPVLVWVTARDPQATEVALRSRGYADYYAPHAGLHAGDVREPWPSVPRIR